MVKADEIKKFEIGFDKPKLLKDYGYGGEVTIQIFYLEKSGNYLGMYNLTRTGTNAIEAFLEEVNTFYILYEEGQPSKYFGVNRNFMNYLKEIKEETITLKIMIYFRDKVGYEKFGDPINLLKPFFLKVDNKLYYENSNKELEAKKAAEEKAAEEKAKKEKKKGSPVLRKLLGR